MLALAPGLPAVFLGIGLWGLYLGLTQGQLSAFVADTAPDDMRGTAFGVFNLLTGMALLIASLLAGCGASLGRRQRFSQGPHLPASRQQSW